MSGAPGSDSQPLSLFSHVGTAMMRGSTALIVACVVACLLPRQARGQVPYHEVVDSVQVPGSAVEWVSGAVLLPATDDRLECGVVLISRGVSAALYESADLRQLVARNRCALAHVRIVGPTRQAAPPVEQIVRNAAIGGGRGVLDLLARVGRTVQRPELDSVPLLVWGFSAAGTFGVTFAESYPDRTLGFIRYHSHARGLSADYARLSEFPALIMAGEDDRVAGVSDSEEFYQAGRDQGADWSFILEPGMPHYPEGEQMEGSIGVMLPWIEKVLTSAQRR